MAQLERLAQAIILLEGWRRVLAAFASGGVAALALAPLDFLPAFALAFPLLVWLLDGAAHGGKNALRATLWVSATIGWWFGFGYFLAGLWWLGSAFIVGGEAFIWLLPLGVVGLPAGLAVFFALGLVIARLLWSPGAGRLFALCFGLMLAEWLRGTLFTGFPWNQFGQAFANHLLLAQSAALIGTEGLGALALVIFASPALIATGETAFSRWALPSLAGLMLVFMAGFGLFRLEASGGAGVDFERLPVFPDIRLRIVQPSTPQAVKNAGGSGQAIFETLLSLSDRVAGQGRAGLADVTHLIWPEAPLPFLLDRQPRAMEALSRALLGGAILITGAIRAESMSGESDRYRFYNALQVFDRDGLQASYDKVHLVPFGEYLPFDQVLRRLGLAQFVAVIGGFTAGAPGQAFSIPGLPETIPVICFESIFPHEMRVSGRGEKILLNVTNDAWFGRTAGPYQHLAQARLRAIEFGTPVIRAANSGISAVIDPYGRQIATLPLESVDVLDSPLPRGLATTLYRDTSWFSFAAMLAVSLIVSSLGLILAKSRRGPVRVA